MRKLVFLTILFIASGSLFGCSSNEAAIIDIPDEPIPQSSFEMIGEIVGFGPGTVELLYNGKLTIFPLTTMETSDFYLGEMVGVARIENELLLDDSVYTLTSIVKPDTAERMSAMGEIIHEIDGIVETINTNNFSIQTSTELIWIETYDNQSLVSGAKMKIDYLNWGDHLMMVQCYDESLRFLLTLAEKERSESGNLILTGTLEDGTELSIQLATSTVLNFSLASLETDDTLAVYPQSAVDKKTSLIHPKRVDRIQFRTHRTIVKPILE